MSPGISTRLLATQSDERLLALAREGHERAFETLVNRYRRPLLNYCRRLSLPEARTEDVVQQALMKTWIALRDGAEVRDIKAWLYRVVHNAAVNAARDAAHDRERLADPTLRRGVAQADLDRGLVVREALAEVAALPPLQREVIVRTAVGGHSHEQVASDLGITDGAVRGLLYRARATLRTAATALTPPPLLSWIAGRAEQGAPASERIGEFAAGGGAAGLGGLLLKGVVVTAATLITSAAVVRLQGSAPRHTRTELAAEPHAAVAAASGSSEGSLAVASTRPAGSRAGERRLVHPHSREQAHVGVGGLVGSAVGAAPGVPRRAGAAPGRGLARSPTTPGASTPVASPEDAAGVQGTVSPQASGQAETGAGTSGAAGAPSGGPVGSAAGAGSASSSGSGSASGSASGSGSETAPGGESGGAHTPSGGESSGASTPSGGEGGGTQTGAGGSEASGGAQSGGVVGAVVHEVGSLVEHLLH